MNAVVGRSTLRQWGNLEMDPGLRRDDIGVGAPPTFHSAASFDYPLDPRQHFMVYPRHWNGFGLSSPERWAYSSAGEHYVDIVGVTSSILVTPTISFRPPSRRSGSIAQRESIRFTREGSQVQSLLLPPFPSFSIRDGLQTGKTCASGAHVPNARCAPVLGYARFRLAPNRN